MSRTSLLALAFCFGLYGCVSDTVVATDAGDAGRLDSGSPLDAGSLDTGAGDTGTPMSNVTVKVINEFGGTPPNVQIRIGGQTATTDANGNATLMAPPTYDATLAYDSAPVSTKRIVVFEGLTTRTPTLQVSIDAPRSTSFTINTMGAFPLGANDVARVVYSPSTASDDLVFAPTLASYPYSNAGWTGRDPNVGKVYAYVLTLANGLPTAWKSQASSIQSYSFGDKANVTTNLTVTPGVATGTISGSLVRNNQFANQVWVWIAPAGDTGRMGFADMSNAAMSFSVVVPSGSVNVVGLGGVQNSVGTFAWKANVAPNVGGLQLAMPASVVALQAPAAMATNVDASTTFSWTGPFPMSRVRVVCPPTGGTYTYMVEILTPRTSLQLPNTTSLGATLPSNAQCVWQVTSFASAATPDEVAAPIGWIHRTDMHRAIQDGAQSTTGRPFTSK